MNKKGISTLFGLISIVSLLTTSCSLHEDETLIVGRWEVRKLITQEGDILGDPPASYIFKFDDDGFLGFNSDVNGCGSDYMIDNSGSFNMERGIWCTQVCCDSDYAEKMMLIASQTNSYEIKRSRLILSGEGGEIKFRKTRY